MVQHFGTPYSRLMSHFVLEHAILIRTSSVTNEKFCLRKTLQWRYALCQSRLLIMIIPRFQIIFLWKLDNFKFCSLLWKQFFMGVSCLSLEFDWDIFRFEAPEIGTEALCYMICLSSNEPNIAEFKMLAISNKDAIREKAKIFKL